MGFITYVVKKGDTLSQIAAANLSVIGATSVYGSNGALNKLIKWNNIQNSNVLVVGQTLKLTNDDSSDSTQSPKNNSNRPIISLFGLQSNSDNTIYAAWTWDKSNTENYEVMWYYATGDGLWFVGTKSTSEFKQSTYSAPSNATKIKFKVKAISKTYTSNGKEVNYWTGDWSTEKIYYMSDNPPKTPSVPTVTLDGYKLTAKLDNLDLNAKQIYFEVVSNNTSVYKVGTSTIRLAHAEYSWTVSAGNEYKVRCKSKRDSLSSDWSEYSDNIKAAPATTKITKVQAKSSTSVYLQWDTIKTATSYDLEYSTRIDAFDNSDDVQSVTGIELAHYEKTGLESGKEYFFRVRAVNETGTAPWSKTVSVALGKAPAAPTTWSSTVAAITGEDINLYWVHNSKDGSSMVTSELELSIGSGEGTSDGANFSKQVYFINNENEEDEKDKTCSYQINTDTFLDGAKIKWRVRTCGVTGVYGDWSIEREINVYSPPTLGLSVTNKDGEQIETLTSFPFYIQATPEPETQTPTGYHVTITANEAYETADQYGNFKMVNIGDEVYSKQFNTSGNLLVIISAENITLENNISYTISCVVSMDSGLTAESSSEFNVAWEDEYCVPNAEIGIDKDNYTANIRPYIENSNGELIDGVLLSVYRRDYDGGFTELMKDINNTSNTFITDPHPALDFARYRIVAKTVATGKISYADLPGYPVEGKGIVLQWNEDWISFDSPEADSMEQPTWSGSMLKLLYNVDITDNNQPDTELIDYIGRKHPVSYYGTHVGSTATWSTVIPKDDIETLYALRRLQNYMGDVYVRESSGSGYWANITVSFSQKHTDVIIPVTLNVTRVEGGI